MLCHRFCRVKVSDSLQLHDDSGSSSDQMKSTEERIPRIGVDNEKEKSKDKVLNTKCVDTLVSGKKICPVDDTIREVSY